MATRIRFYVFAIVIIAGAIVTLSSCANGYGCTGKSKSITGYKSEKYRGY